MSYAIVKTGGKQYRVEQGQSLLVERLAGEDGSRVQLQPLLYVDGSTVVDGDELSKVNVEARIVGQERGPKLRVVKFKPKRGYKRRTGHRQDLTRIEVTAVKLASRSSRKTAAAEAEEAPKPVAAEEPKPVAAAEPKPVAAAEPKPLAAAEPKAEAPEEPEAAAPAEPETSTPEDTDGA